MQRSSFSVLSPHWLLVFAAILFSCLSSNGGALAAISANCSRDEPIYCPATGSSECSNAKVQCIDGGSFLPAWVSERTEGVIFDDGYLVAFQIYQQSWLIH